MSDARDIMELETPVSKGKGKKKEKKRAKDEADQLESDKPKKVVVGKLGQANRLSRDVKNLQSAMLGSNIKSEETGTSVKSPVLAAVHSAAKKKKRVVPWKACQYQSKEVRGVTLTHVRPITDPKRETNAFLSLNKPFVFCRYSDEQYQAMLSRHDWTREETDRLMRLVEDLDGRMNVVFDRWTDDAGRPQRTLEDLKERYYEIQRLLQLDRKEADEFQFDAEQERLRKRHSEILYNRTGHEVWEEFELKKEYGAIEAELAKSKAAVARSKTFRVALDHGVKDYTSIKFEEKNAAAASAAAAAAAAAASASSGQKKDEDEAFSLDQSTKKKGSRASGSVSASQASLAKLNAATDKFLSDHKLPMRASEVKAAQQLHSELRNTIMALFDLETLYEQKCYEVELLKARKEELLKQTNESK